VSLPHRSPPAGGGDNTPGERSPAGMLAGACVDARAPMRPNAL
jgi:hypothetical protein